MSQAFRPTSLDELQQVVSAALSQEEPMELVGAGTKRRLGRPVQAEHELSTTGLAGVDMYEPEELVMSAGAGTPLSAIEAMLAERNQELQFEPADYGLILGGAAGRQTIGGVFAANLAGPRRLKAGAARDHLLGLVCVTGRGQVIKTGGRVVKNVTGYDLCKLLAGSFGTLAVMGRVTFKVMPAAEDAATLLLAHDDEAALLAALRDAMGSPFEVSSAALLPAAASARSSVPQIAAAGIPLACLRLEGATPSVAYRVQALRTRLLEHLPADASVLERQDSLTLWREIRDLELLDAAAPLLWRISCPPTEGARLAGIVRSVGGEVLYDWSGGLVWAAMPLSLDADAPQLRGALAGCGGHATILRAPAELRLTVPPFEPQPPALAALSARVKASFDPQGILNPGRMVAI